MRAFSPVSARQAAVRQTAARLAPAARLALAAPAFALPALALLGLALLGLALPPGATAQTAAPSPAPARTSVKVIDVKGGIGPGLVHTLRNGFAEVDLERFPAGAVLLLDSGGGDGLAAIEIGRIARAAQAHVFVRGRCTSACMFILAGGVVRGSGAEHAVGIHRPRLTTFVKDIGFVDINPASNPKAVSALALANRRSEEFLRDMGLPETLFNAMMAVPSEMTRFLTGAELNDYGLLGFDPAYLAARAPLAEARYGVTRQEFVRRTLQVHDKCVVAYTNADEFVRCYRRVLETGA